MPPTSRPANSGRRGRLAGAFRTAAAPRAPRPVRAMARIVAGMFRGDRPLVVMTLVIGVLGVSLLVGPAQRYFDERARVDLLRQTEAVLDHEVSLLERRVTDLHETEHIEILAREQHGMVRIGEIAYAIVPPDVEHDIPGTGVTSAASQREADAAQPWAVRWWAMLTSMLQDRR